MVGQLCSSWHLDEAAYLGQQYFWHVGNSIITSTKDVMFMPLLHARMIPARILIGRVCTFVVMSLW